MSWRANPPLALAALAVVLVAAVLAASASGAVSIPLRELPSLLGGTPTPEQALWRNVLIDIRLPRVLLAVVMGAGLAISGAALQALFRNPLAEPGLIGISAGASLGAVAAIVLTHGGFWYTAPGAFFGSLIATLSAYAVGRRVPGVAGLLLAGVAITAIAFSLIGLFTFMATDAQLRDLTFWNMGSLAGASWKLLAFLAPWVLVLSLWLMRQWRVMNALLLGEREAQHLGYSLKQARARLVLACTLIVGPLVAASGTIVFVGLVVPHLVRMTLGANHRLLLPACLLGGGLVMVLADWLARIVVVPAELPIGLVTGLVGGPFFLWLLARGRRHG